AIVRQDARHILALAVRKRILAPVSFAAIGFADVVLTDAGLGIGLRHRFRCAANLTAADEQKAKTLFLLAYNLSETGNVVEARGRTKGPKTRKPGTQAPGLMR
ncbi:hypothetical protein PVW46_14245, partial [Mameliella sp. AT18]|uniref:hypothetical protein n=1 Tax=Mameliella sp. AT18 TaxID=3028385 RepID=UPI00237BCDD1